MRGRKVFCPGMKLPAAVAGKNTCSCCHRWYPACSNCHKCVIVGENMFLGPTIHLPRLRYFLECHHLLGSHEMCCFFSDTLSKEAVIPMHSPWSEFAATLAAYFPEDAFIDLTANSILEVIILKILVKTAFWILSSTLSTMLPISLSNHSLKQFSKVWTFTVFSLVVEKLLLLLTV